MDVFWRPRSDILRPYMVLLSGTVEGYAYDILVLGPSGSDHSQAHALAGFSWVIWPTGNLNYELTPCTRASFVAT